MPLSDAKCRNASPKEKLYKLADGGGLTLRITPTGGKYWVLRYRYMGKAKDLSLGAYPAVSLIEARDKRDAAKRDLRAGENPAISKLVKKLDIEAEVDGTFKSIAMAWMDNKRPSISPRYAAQIESRLAADIYPHLGKMPIASITPPQLLKVLKKVQSRGVVETVHRLKQYCSMICCFAVANGYLEHDITRDLRAALPASKSEHFAAISANDIPNFLKKLADSDIEMGIQTRLAMRFLMLTFVRTTELIGARWDEIDIGKKQWIIPGRRMKKKRDHIVPLSNQAITILQTMRKLSSGPMVFPGRSDPKKGMSNMTVLKGLERMGYKGFMTGHGFRALAMTTLREELGFPFEIIDLQLAHIKKSKVDRAYDRSKFLKERTTMMQAWADYIDKSDIL